MLMATQPRSDGSDLLLALLGDGRFCQARLVLSSYPLASPRPFKSADVPDEARLSVGTPDRCSGTLRSIATISPSVNRRRFARSAGSNGAKLLKVLRPRH
eukprot:NODE_383_length_2326_cov_28.758454_g297_i1.p5 GENE.NODE_383_length_2326_cov_28.758454_g297_i1~~NODE_383_length_2326_cov_28.758454_g297_i1.p5  ORF type:complete len:100 (+),score=5.11 NODE_383_length_2326_cov_28.758454_g297_i1:1042-1341(+)